MANPTTSNRPHHHPVWAVLLFLLFLFHFFLDSQPPLTALCTERVVFRRLAPGQHLLVNPHLLIRRIEPLVITAQSDPRLDGIDTLSYRFLRSSATHMGGLLFWYGIYADGNRTIQMQQSMRKTFVKYPPIPFLSPGSVIELLQRRNLYADLRRNHEK